MLIILFLRTCYLNTIILTQEILMPKHTLMLIKIKLAHEVKRFSKILPPAKFSYHLNN